MKFGIPAKHTFARKILIVFLLSSIIPIGGLAVLSQEYVANSITQDTLNGLKKDAKSYGLYTFERLTTINRQLDNLSLSINDHIPISVKRALRDFEKLELNLSNNSSPNLLDQSAKSVLTTLTNDDGELAIRIEKLHTSKHEDKYILRGEIKAERIWGNQENNIFTEPVCIFEDLNNLLFCSDDTVLKVVNLEDLKALLLENNQALLGGEKNKKYMATIWELYLPAHYQANSWKFVTLKSQNSILTIINMHRGTIFPVALIFFLIIVYWLLHATDRLLYPLFALAKATDLVSKGNFDVRVNVGSKDEFEGLSNSFNDMAKNLDVQFSKSKALSLLDQNALEVLDIHYTVKNSLPGILKALMAQWVAISIKDPGETNIVTTHCMHQSSNAGENNSYQRLSHRINPFKYITDPIELNHYEFKQMFSSFGEKVNASLHWLKKVEIENDTVCYITVGVEETRSLCASERGILQELAERIAIIYTSYQQKNKLYRQAHNDELTNLPNRNHMLEELKKAWDSSIVKDTCLAILFIDLDHFKKVNDLSGHQVGNEVLKQVAERINDCVSKKNLVARLSGDEFCVLMNPVRNINQAKDVAEKITQSFVDPFVVKELSYFLGSSIGVAIGPEGCGTSEQLLERADLAMFTAKEQGRSQVVLYDDKIEKDRSLRLSLERDLHFALENKEIGIMYQPKMDLVSGRLSSVEALARWTRPNLGVVQTDYFISIAEDAGLIHDIGAWILKQACDDFVSWKKRKIEIESVAVNVSAYQLAAKNYPAIVQSVIEQTGITPSCLELEITESAFIQDEGLLVEELDKLHKLGTKISIDDFGKEYSSLSYLRKMPFDTLKIDREFIIDLETSDHDKQIINVIISIGHVLNKKIVAEGIETLLQRNILRELGCDLGQGYLFSRPISNEAFIEFASKYVEVGQETEILEDLSDHSSKAWSS